MYTHVVNILDCEESKLFKQGALLHSELFIWSHLDLDSLKTQARTAKICKHTRILDIVKSSPEGESPMISKGFLPDSAYFLLHPHLNQRGNPCIRVNLYCT